MQELQQATKSGVAPAPDEPQPSSRLNYQKFLDDLKGGVQLRDALKSAGKTPNRHQRRTIETLARKYGLTCDEALGFWRRGLR